MEQRDARREARPAVLEHGDRIGVIEITAATIRVGAGGQHVECKAGVAQRAERVESGHHVVGPRVLGCLELDVENPARDRVLGLAQGGEVGGERPPGAAGVPEPGGLDHPRRYIETGIAPARVMDTDVIGERAVAAAEVVHGSRAPARGNDPEQLLETKQLRGFGIPIHACGRRTMRGQLAFVIGRDLFQQRTRRHRATYAVLLTVTSDVFRRDVCWQPVVIRQLHSAADASPLTALLLPHIWTICSVVAPCHRGASPSSVPRWRFTTDCQCH